MKKKFLFAAILALGLLMTLPAKDVIVGDYVVVDDVSAVADDTASEGTSTIEDVIDILGIADEPIEKPERATIRGNGIEAEMNEKIRYVEETVEDSRLSEKPVYPDSYTEIWHILNDLVADAERIRSSADGTISDMIAELDDYVKNGDGTVDVKSIDKTATNTFKAIQKAAGEPLEELIAEIRVATDRLDGSVMEFEVSGTPEWNQENLSWKVPLSNEQFSITLILPYEAYTGKRLSVPSEKSSRYASFMADLTSELRECESQIEESVGKASVHADFDEKNGQMDVWFTTVKFPNSKGKDVKILSWDGLMKSDIRLELYSHAVEKSMVDGKYSFKNGKVKERYSGPGIRFGWKASAGAGALVSLETSGNEIVMDTGASVGATLFNKIYLGGYADAHFFTHDAILLDLGGEIDLLFGKDADFALFAKGAWNWEQSLLNMDFGMSYRIGSLFNLGLEVTTRDMFSVIGGRVTVGVSGL